MRESDVTLHACSQIKRAAEAALFYSVPIPAQLVVVTHAAADGAADGDEITLYGTEPTVADTDGDGVFDGEELFEFFVDEERLREIL